MPREKVVASKGKIRIDNSDGTYTELGFMMPHNIAEKILCDIITWEEDWVTNTKTHLEYQEVSKEFSERLKKDKETPSA